MMKRAAFTHRRLNVSHAAVQGDVIEGTALIIEGGGLPRTLAELRACRRPSKRFIQIACNTTTRRAALPSARNFTVSLSDSHWLQSKSFA